MQRRCLEAWRQAAGSRHERRVLYSMADVHRERKLLQLGLSAFAANIRGMQAASPRQHSGLGSAHPAVPAALQQWRQQQKRQQASHSTTVIISRGHSAGVAGQQQQWASPQRAAGSTGGCASLAAAAQGVAASVGEAVTNWRAAANYWRQRQQSYTSAPLPIQLAHLQQSGVDRQDAAPAATSHHTAATLAERRQRQPEICTST